MNRRKLLLTAILFEGGLGFIALVVGWWVGTAAFGRFYLNWKALFYGAVATAPMLAALAWCIRAAWPQSLVRMNRQLREIVETMFANCTVLDLAVISALAGVCEEALFRGVVQTALTPSLGVWYAIGVASVLFGLAHYVSLSYAVMAAVVGAYLGFLLVIFGNLLVPVLAHALYDFLALLYLTRYRLYDR